MCFTCLYPPYESRKDLELFSSLFITVIELDVKFKKNLQLLIDCFVFYAVSAIFQEPAVTLLEYCRYGVKHKTTNHSLLQNFFLNLTIKGLLLYELIKPWRELHCPSRHKVSGNYLYKKASFSVEILLFTKRFTKDFFFQRFFSKFFKDFSWFPL